MNFEFTEEQRIFRENVAEFCKRWIEPRWIEIDESGRIDPELVRRMASQGLIGLVLDEEYGGQGGGFVEAAIASEEIAYHAPALSLAVLNLLQNSWAYIVQLYGSRDAAAEVLPRVTSGEALVGIASTEAHGGSDVAGIRLRATRTGDDRWIVSGEKSMVSLPSIIKEMPWGGGWVLIARTGPVEERHNSITTFLALMKRGGVLLPGISYKPWTEFARRGLDTSVVTFSDFVLEDRYRIGETNKGFKIAMEGFNLARSLIGAVTIGCARWLIERGIEWIKQRIVFGRPIASYQSISFRLAEHLKELEAARLLCYKAAWVADRYYREKRPGTTLRDVALYGAMSKLKCASLAVDIGEDVMKWYGGASYYKELPIFRAWLGAFSYVVGAEGTENMMKLIIARETLGKEFIS
ncbi:MAG: acyl-CoA dehydrogenase family protein [Candidatus Caldarchaeales archaeon]|jgi:acyl-CoA dehydrogenase|nr:acyl-CoA dehydrogenase family protein [Candidatus Caldarchaeales archaeon]MDT7915561.1 acyl-CoA dehydrogenase family protein [Candidatus Caldarchaeales archaeon]